MALRSGAAAPPRAARLRAARWREGAGARAQELLLILEEYWERNPALRGVPIYQASGLAQKALTVYQTYIEMMNDAIKAAFQARAPPAHPPRSGTRGHDVVRWLVCRAPCPLLLEHLVMLPS